MLTPHLAAVNGRDRPSHDRPTICGDSSRHFAAPSSPIARALASIVPSRPPTVLTVRAESHSSAHSDEKIYATELTTVRAARNLWNLRHSQGQVAQLVEQRTENPCVGGSTPPLTTTATFGRLWPKALICNSLGPSNSSPSGRSGSSRPTRVSPHSAALLLPHFDSVLSGVVLWGNRNSRWSRSY